MRRPIPKKFRGASKRPSLFTLVSGLRIPGLLLLAALLTGGVFYFLGSGAQAKPLCPDFSPAPFDPVCRWRGEIKKDESLYIALTDNGFSPRVVYDIDRGLDGILNLRQILPGEKFCVDTDQNGKLVRFELERSPWEHYYVTREEDSFIGEKDTIPLTYVLKAAKGEVKGTLWESMIAEGIPAEVVLRFTDILSFNVDFLTETRDGQRFALLYEQYFFDGKPIDVGRVMAAEYWISDTSYGGIYYMDPDSSEGYYTLAGKNTKKALLKTPLVYRRISSYFSHRRFHPILKIYRPHLGVDYAAPTGTPISASGAGTVVFAGRKGGFGNFVHIKHNGNIETMYGHMSRFAKGIRKGVRVKQGQLIGYVGATGLATGPHLDYRVKVGGKFVNPLRYAFPDGPPIKGKYMKDFKAKANDRERLLRMLSNDAIVMKGQ